MISRGATRRFQFFWRPVRIAVAICVLSLPSIGAVVRPFSFSGSSYPADPKYLYSQIEAFLKTVPQGVGGPVGNSFENVHILIIPYAPYLYTGSIMARGYNAVGQQKYERVLIVGNAPSVPVPSVYSGSRFSTPLGQLPSDDIFTEKLLAITTIQLERAAPELPLPRSIECQLPFVQYLYGERPIIAIGIPEIPESSAIALANSIAEIVAGSRTLVIASTNLSEMSDARMCEAVDYALLDCIKKLAVDRVIANNAESDVNDVILIAMQTAISLGADKGAILQYSNTGQITGDRYHYHSSIGSVGFLAAVLGKVKEQDVGTANRAETNLTEEEGQYLLSLVRRAISEKLGITDAMSEKPQYFKRLLQPAGIYLSIYEGNDYRGGVGSLFAYESLIKEVKKVAVASAFNDPRYTPITTDEIDELTLRIHILTDIHRFSESSEFNPSSEGVIVKRGSYSAMVLPGEMDIMLDNAAILDRVCLKAGLLSRCWSQPGSELWAFNAQQFKER